MPKVIDRETPDLPIGPHKPMPDQPAPVRHYDGSGPGRRLVPCPDCGRESDADFDGHGGQCVAARRRR